MNAPIQIRLKEQTSTHLDLSPEAASRLYHHPGLRALRAKQILRWDWRERGYASLRAFNWVGDALLDRYWLIIEPKIAGAHHGLTDVITAHDGYLIDEPGGRAVGGSLSVHLVRRLLDAVDHFLAHGLDQDFTHERYEGSFLAGRLDLPRTLLLRATGRIDRLAGVRTVLKGPTPSARVAAAALGAFQDTPTWDTLTSAEQQRLRHLSTLLLPDPIVLSGVPLEELQAEAKELVQQAVITVERTVVTLAELILLGQQVVPGPSDRSLFSLFLSLPELFERAVRSGLAHHLRPGMRLTQEAEPLYIERKHAHRREPDIVIRYGTDRIAVGDAKYRFWRDQGYSDVHNQLTTYAALWKATHAFVIFIHDTYVEEQFGSGPTGAETWCFGVTLHDLHADLKRVMVCLFGKEISF